jgi:hypothetical protein
MPSSSRALRHPSRNRAADRAADPAAAASSPFPPAKSDDEIAALVVEMGAELGVARRRSVPSPSPVRTAPRRPVKARPRPAPAPPPVPDWALDATAARRPGTRLRAS